MIRPILCFTAEAVVRDAESNSISAFNLIEGITAEGFPVFVQRLAFFVLWQRAAEDPPQYHGRFTVRSASTELFNRPVDIEFQEKLKNRTILSIRGLVVPQPGTLSFELSLDAGESARYAIEVNAITSATEPGGAASADA